MAALMTLQRDNRNHQQWQRGPFVIMIQQGRDIGHINATSTRECTFRAVFAAECGRVSANAGSEKL
uniref:hypothetical protein n=2 Tax=Yoonia sp. TaxID=2212373 RepID=UPI0040485F25